MEPKKKGFVKGKHIRTDWGHGVTQITKVNKVAAPGTPPPQAAQLEIGLDDETAQGKYANLASIGHGETEFILDFLFLAPNQNKAKVHTRIVSSPQHTKRLLAALADNVKRYEARFGEIRLHNPQQH